MEKRMPDRVGSPGILDIELNERLHVDIGASCNNNCIFCMEDDRQGRKARMDSLTPESLKRILDANRFRREVVFVSGEPTLSPHFLPALRWAKEMGYERIGVITNGRRFAYLPFARSTLENGLNVAMVSIHGADAAVLHGGERGRVRQDEADEHSRHYFHREGRGDQLLD